MCLLFIRLLTKHHIKCHAFQFKPKFTRLPLHRDRCVSMFLVCVCLFHTLFSPPHTPFPVFIRWFSSKLHSFLITGHIFCDTAKICSVVRIFLCVIYIYMYCTMLWWRKYWWRQNEHEHNVSHMPCYTKHFIVEAINIMFMFLFQSSE